MKGNDTTPLPDTRGHKYSMRAPTQRRTENSQHTTPLRETVGTVRAAVLCFVLWLCIVVRALSAAVSGQLKKLLAHKIGRAHV